MAVNFPRQVSYLLFLAHDINHRKSFQIAVLQYFTIIILTVTSVFTVYTVSHQSASWTATHIHVAGQGNTATVHDYDTV